MCSFHGLLHSRPTTEAEPFNSHKRMPKDEYLGDYFFGWRFKVTDRPLSQMTQVSRWSPIKTLSPRLDQDAPTPWEAAVQTLPLQVCIQNCSSKQLQQGVPRSHWKWRQRWWSPSGHNCWALSDFMIGYICFRIFAIQAIRVFVPVRFFSIQLLQYETGKQKHKNSLYWCQVSCLEVDVNFRISLRRSLVCNSGGRTHLLGWLRSPTQDLHCGPFRLWLLHPFN